MRRLPLLIVLRFFEETAQRLSFNRAAAALCVTQGAVSRRIRLPESSLGFDRFECDHTGNCSTSTQLGLYSVWQKLSKLLAGARFMPSDETFGPCSTHVRYRMFYTTRCLIFGDSRVPITPNFLDAYQH
jgi:hypothetical protein